MSTFTWSIPDGKGITGQTYIKDTDEKLADTIDDLVDFVNGEGIHNGQGLTFDLVDKANPQTITGSKTFTSPINGDLSGNVTGDVTGNSDTTTALKTERSITLIGGATGTATFNGTADANISVEVTDNEHNHTVENVTGLQAELDGLEDSVEAIENGNGLNPTGMVITFAGNTAPSGYLECNGAAISRTTYSTLFSAIGGIYGNGDGNSTFNLPDLRGEFIRGYDNGRGVDSGRALGSEQSYAMERIQATITFSGEDNRVGFVHSTDGIATFSSGGSADSETGEGRTGLGRILTLDSDLTTQTADETRPRNIAMMYCIKT